MEYYDMEGKPVTYEETMIMMGIAHEEIKKSGRMILIFNDAIKTEDGEKIPQFGLMKDTTFGFTFE